MKIKIELIVEAQEVYPATEYIPEETLSNEDILQFIQNDYAVDTEFVSNTNYKIVSSSIYEVG